MKKMIMMLAAMLVIAGCSSEVTPPEEAGGAAQTESATTDVLSKVVGKTVATTDNMAIPPVKKTAIPGQAVTLNGKVMGTMHPFVKNRAVMIIGDEATIVSCDMMGDDDHCQTPWDVCCEDKEKIQAGTATIQVVDENGQPVRAGLKGVGGLKELSKVRVSGVVDKGSSPGLLIVNAEAIEVL